MVDDRIAARRAEVRSSRRRARLRRTLLGLVVLVLIGGGVWFEGSEHATVRSVVVEGTTLLDEATVVAASDVAAGDPAVRLWPASVVDRVELLPLVRSATVGRRGLRDVIITVEERAPVYVVTYRMTSSLVDREGIVLAREGDERLPTVRVVTPPPAPGETVVGHAALANAHRVWQGLSGPLRSRVVEMRAPDEDGLELVLEDAPVVVFGRSEQLDEKVRALGAILDDVAGSDVTLVDVRVPGFPVVRAD